MKIERLTIKTKKLKEQLRFYKDRLGFELISYHEKSFLLKAGYSELCLEYDEHFTPYHLAFHIPDETEEEAVKWIENERPVLKDNGEKIIDFSNWKAKSVYFYDEDHNIVELISRRDFQKSKSALFSADSIIGIAEIGLSVTEVEPVFRKLRSDCLLHQYDGDLENFCAIGDEEGLLICVNQHHKKWFPTSDKAKPAFINLDFQHRGKHFNLIYDKTSIQLSEK